MSNPLELSADSLSALKSIVKQDDPKKARRALTVIAASFGTDFESLARIFNKNENWARNVVSNFLASGLESITDVKTSPGRPLKYDESDRDVVRQVVQENPKLSLTGIRKEVNKRLGKAMSIPTVRGIMSESGFTSQRTRRWNNGENDE